MRPTIAIRRALASILPLGIVLGLAGEAQARPCSDLYDDVKAEAMYCGFFCDADRLQATQRAYEAACIRIVLPLSLFDVDSTPVDAAANVSSDLSLWDSWRGMIGRAATAAAGPSQTR